MNENKGKKLKTFENLAGILEFVYNIWKSWNSRMMISWKNFNAMLLENWKKQVKYHFCIWFLFSEISKWKAKSYDKWKRLFYFYFSPLKSKFLDHSILAVTYKWKKKIRSENKERILYVKSFKTLLKQPCNMLGNFNSDVYSWCHWGFGTSEKWPH